MDIACVHLWIVGASERASACHAARTIMMTIITIYYWNDFPIRIVLYLLHCWVCAHVASHLLTELWRWLFLGSRYLFWHVFDIVIVSCNIIFRDDLVFIFLIKQSTPHPGQNSAIVLIRWEPEAQPTNGFKFVCQIEWHFTNYKRPNGQNRNVWWKF